MPLLFEVNDPESVLYFVPSGHLVRDQFVDFPNQSRGGCWYFATWRLATLYHTQSSFDLSKESSVLQAISVFMRATTDLDNLKYFAQAIMQSIICKRLLIKYQEISPIIERLTLQSSINLIQEYNKKINEEDRESLAQLFAHNEQGFKLQCQVLAKKLEQVIQQIIINKQFDKIATNLAQTVDYHFDALEEKLLVKFFKEHPECASLDDLDSKVSGEELAKKVSSYRGVVTQIYMSEMGLTLFPGMADPRGAAWKDILMFVLRKQGPFAIGGFVGVPYYNGAEPEKKGTLGSVELLGFAKGTYKEKSIAHMVVVIGITHGKVVYLDPTQVSKVDGPRQAYIMDADSFMQRVLRLHKMNNVEPFLRFMCLNNDRIDTTEELMRAQTSNATSAKKRLIA